MDFPEIEVDEHMMALTEKSSYFEDHNRVTRVVKESARCCMMGIFGHVVILALEQKYKNIQSMNFQLCRIGNLLMI